MDSILKMAPPEERIYRLRCVEGWSIVVPWVGFSLSELIKRANPTSKAEFVEFTTIYDPGQMPGQQRQVLQWPYVEGLRMDEAMHPLTLLCFGMYGEDLPNQDGAPIRIVVPWKYGFKSAKAIVRVRFTEKQPLNTWNISNSQEYGLYSNVNPARTITIRSRIGIRANRTRRFPRCRRWSSAFRKFPPWAGRGMRGSERAGKILNRKDREGVAKGAKNICPGSQFGQRLRRSQSKQKLKLGCKKLTTTEIIEVPKLELNNKIAFGILCALEVCDNTPYFQEWAEWALNWLSGKDRTKYSKQNRRTHRGQKWYQ